MKFYVCAELEGQSGLIRGIDYTIFTKNFEIELPEEAILERAFNNRSMGSFEIEYDGLSLKIVKCYPKDRRLHARGLIGRSECSTRTFKRLQDLGWVFYPAVAEKLGLPSQVGPLNDRFFWERLSHQAV